MGIVLRHYYTNYIKVLPASMESSKSWEKFKKVFEDIDKSGDKKVSPQELGDFLNTEKANEILHKKMSNEELQELAQEVGTLDANDKNEDGKLSFEEFKETINAKENDKFRNFILKMSEDSDSDSD